MAKSNTNFSKVDRLVNAAMAEGLSNLGRDVQKRAIILAPKDTGRLRQSTKIQINMRGDTVAISFNTPYAKVRHYSNNLNPSTKLYLTQALKSIKSSTLKSYFKARF